MLDLISWSHSRWSRPGRGDPHRLGLGWSRGYHNFSGLSFQLPNPSRPVRLPAKPGFHEPSVDADHDPAAKGEQKIHRHLGFRGIFVKVAGREPKGVLGVCRRARQRPAGCGRLQELVQLGQPPPWLPTVRRLSSPLVCHHSQTLWDQAFQGVLTEALQRELNRLGSTQLTGYSLWNLSCTHTCLWF